MKKLAIVAMMAAVVQVSACATASQDASSRPADGNYASSDAGLSMNDADTVLLVSLADGSVVKQSISGSADICFKQNSKSETTCLTQGAPIFDPDTQQIIAYRMIEDQIQLLPGN